MGEPLWVGQPRVFKKNGLPGVKRGYATGIMHALQKRILWIGAG